MLCVERSEKYMLNWISDAFISFFLYVHGNINWNEDLLYVLKWNLNEISAADSEDGFLLRQPWCDSLITAAQSKKEKNHRKERNKHFTTGTSERCARQRENSTLLAVAEVEDCVVWLEALQHGDQTCSTLSLVKNSRRTIREPLFILTEGYCRLKAPSFTAIQCRSSHQGQADRPIPVWGKYIWTLKSLSAVLHITPDIILRHQAAVNNHIIQTEHMWKCFLWGITDTMHLHYSKMSLQFSRPLAGGCCELHL